MKINILSDLHLEFENINLDNISADVIILAGDIHTKKRGIDWALNNIKETPVLYVMGNHEFYGKAYPRLISSCKEMTVGTNITILENDMTSIDGINFFGCTLWSDFSLIGDPRLAGYHCEQHMNDFRRIRVSPKFSKLSAIDAAAIHRRSLNWLKEQLKVHKNEVNIVITHHAPSALSLSDHYKHDACSAAYASHLDNIIEEYSPTLWVHGHIHESLNYKIGNCQIVCNPRGYPGYRNSEFNKNLIIDVKSK